MKPTQVQTIMASLQEGPKHWLRLGAALMAAGHSADEVRVRYAIRNCRKYRDAVIYCCDGVYTLVSSLPPGIRRNENGTYAVPQTGGRYSGSFSTVAEALEYRESVYRQEPTPEQREHLQRIKESGICGATNH